MSLPVDYLDRVYAGVLGKLIGVYLGRPFENWSHQRIMKELGEIQYYVHDRLNHVLVTTDDDIAGTFTFLRALRDHRISPDLTAEEIGKTWLNYLIEDRTVLWWGGRGNSTEHTAWLNLRDGIAAPASGSIATNGQTVAEQIGAQIFIDGWAMVAPGNPALAAKLAEQAGKVSHDGEAVNAAVLWAAMEAEAFVSNDMEHLIDTGLSFIPADSLIARLVADIRGWHKQFPNWLDTRQKIEDNYGYDKYRGVCHVVPNHAVMIMSLLYAPDDFQKSQTIVNTAGWDTDCNAGNVGCLMGIKLGLAGLDAGPDWRGPVADRCLISSADGGNAVNDAVQLAYDIADLGSQLAGQGGIAAPKAGARFHFSLPGSLQGFRAETGHGLIGHLDVANVGREGDRRLALRFDGLAPGRMAAATTPTFALPETVNVKGYQLMAAPTLYPGQTVSARVISDAGNGGAIKVALRLRVYGKDDALVDIDAPAQVLASGKETILTWEVPATDGQPIAEVGIVLSAEGKTSAGIVYLDWLSWSGAPRVRLARPAEPSTVWRRAWVNNVDFFSKYFPESFRISQDHGPGLLICGTREWTDYTVSADLVIPLAESAGLAVRVQGGRRYCAVRLTRANRLEIVSVHDDETSVLADVAMDMVFEKAIAFSVTVAGNAVSAEVGGVSLKAELPDNGALADGGVALFVEAGALSTNAVSIAA